MGNGGIVRTVIIVVILLALILVSGGSMVVRAQDVGSATLERQCAPEELQSGVDTLLRCTFTARNTGSVPLAGATVEFQATSGALPDAYYFWSAARDRLPLPVFEGQLDYPFGDIAAGASSSLDIEVIVRSTHAFAADAVLLAGADRHVYARQAVGRDVVPAGEPQLTAQFVSKRSANGEPSAVFGLTVRNQSDRAFTNVEIAVATGPSATAHPTAEWVDKRDGFVLTAIPKLAPGESYETALSFEGKEQPCAFVHPAAVISAVDGNVGISAAAIADAGASLGECTGQGGGGDVPAQTTERGSGGAAVIALPSAGTGASIGSPVRAVLASALLGLLLGAAGLSVRRTHRSRR